jgi:hypothetical protein
MESGFPCFLRSSFIHLTFVIRISTFFPFPSVLSAQSAVTCRARRYSNFEFAFATRPPILVILIILGGLHAQTDGRDDGFITIL